MPSPGFLLLLYVLVCACILTSAVTGYRVGRYSAGEPYRPRHAAPRHAPARAVPAPLPALPARAELEVDYAYRHALYRATPRAVPPVVTAAIQVAALRATVALLGVSAGILARWSDDRVSLERYPDLAPAWDEDTGTFPAIVGEVAA